MSALKSAAARTSTMRKRAGYAARRWRSGTLIVGGFGFLSAAAWTWDTTVGLAAVGLSLLVLEWSTKESQ